VGPVDLRSDTVTRPTPAMRAAMAKAEVGDDVFGDDPTVIALEARASAMFGMEAGLYFPSGTQSNLAALMAHCARGEEVILGQDAHTYKYEGGGAAVLGSIQPQPLANLPTALDPAMVRGGHQADDPTSPSRGSGAREHHRREGDRARLPRGRDARMETRPFTHLDGARIFNAA
jgi:threonine aldolase